MLWLALGWRAPTYISGPSVIKKDVFVNSLSLRPQGPVFSGTLRPCHASGIA